jgi:hypothetical protein
MLKRRDNLSNDKKNMHKNKVSSRCMNSSRHQVTKLGIAIVIARLFMWTQAVAIAYSKSLSSTSANEMGNIKCWYVSKILQIKI